MASAIVRNCIANSTIDQIVKNRQGMRDAIRAEMSEVVLGWGVWLETIEITDVKIASASLFRDMQTQFLEQQRKTALFQKSEVDDQIRRERRKHELEDFKRSQMSQKEKLASQHKNTIFQKNAEL